MQFNKAYNRQEFVEFLRHSFLPDDFYAAETPVSLRTQTKFTASVTKLGTCDSLDLVVYEIRHRSKNDARVGLSKEAFRVLADEWQDRALVIFVPEESNSIKPAACKSVKTVPLLMYSNTALTLGCENAESAHSPSLRIFSACFS